MAIDADRVLILDEIDVKPGQSSAVREAFVTSYRPGAEARGMVLEAAWQHPPAIDVPELPATLFYLWSVNQSAGWWAQRLARHSDGSDMRDDKQRFWQSLEPLIEGRKRRVLTDQPSQETSA